MWRLSAPFFALLLNVSAAYALDTDKPLADDEGWLAVIVDNEANVSSVRLDGPGLLGDGLVKDLGDGRNVRVLRAKAGNYRWSMLNRPSQSDRNAYEYLNIRPDPAFAFTVEAGKFNYPGNFVLRANGLRYIGYHRSNNALQAMMGLDVAYPGLRSKYPWRNDVTSADPFESFAAATLKPDSSAALLASSEADARKTAAVAVDEAFAAAFNDIYAPPRAHGPALSPDGQRLVFIERRSANHDVVVVVDLASGETLDLLAVPGEFNELAWGGNRSLYIGMAVDAVKVAASAKGQRFTVPITLASGLMFIRFGEGKLGAANLTRIKLPGEIALLNALYGDDDRGIVTRTDSRGGTHVFAFDETATSFDVKNFRNEHRLDKGLDDAYAFFSDAGGELRGAFVTGKNGTYAVAARATDGTWTVHPPLPDNTDLRAVSLNAQGNELVVLTNFEREQVEIATLDLASGHIGKTLIAEPGIDLAGAVTRTRDAAVIGATFFRNGQLQTRFLPGDETLLAGVSKQFPDANVAVWDDSLDGKRLVLRVSSEINPGSFYLFDRDEHRLEKLIDVYDPFKHIKPVASTAFNVTAPDGLRVEAFLSLTADSKGKAPLVVMPHGGPIGASDRRVFDPLVQMLTHSGYAVLRVNYRGSGGAGRAFEQAGYGKWGREIEADVALALDHALANYPLDRNRVALWGASYGGYSALMGLIREPERYQCAVAISAVTDLPLMFSSSDWARDAKTVAHMKRIVGDPDTALGELREYSPDYQFQRLKKPLLLIHGMDDARVSFEHSWRLRNLLAAAGSPPAWLPLPGADHSLSRIKDRLAMHAASDAFLRECLAQKPAP